MSRRTFIGAGAILVSDGALGALASPPSERPAVALLHADVDLLQSAFERLHPGLYRYNTAATLSAHLDRLRGDLAAVPASRDWLAPTYLAFARFAATLRCGHTYANFFNQSDAVRRTLFERRDKLPAEFRWIDSRMLVTRDLSVEQALPAGTVIASVNGVSTDVLLRELLAVARADGSNDAKRVAQMELQGYERYESFDVYQSLLAPGKDERLQLICERPGRSGPERVDVRALSHAERLAARRVPAQDERRGWRFDTSDPDCAVLKMPDWALYDTRWDWKAFIADSFERLAASKCRALAIDLRGNEGGLDCGDEILPYLVTRELVIDEPPRLVRYRDVPGDLDPYLDTWDKSFRHWGEDAQRLDDRFYTLRQDGTGTGPRRIAPRSPHFAGRVFVWIGPDNSSATFQFAQLVRASRLGTLVGRPTGGNLRGINGGAFFFLRLPGSGLEIDLPLIARFPPGPPPDAGIVPDVGVHASVADILAGTDLERAATRAQRGLGTTS